MIDVLPTTPGSVVRAQWSIRTDRTPDLWLLGPRGHWVSDIGWISTSGELLVNEVLFDAGAAT